MNDVINITGKHIIIRAQCVHIISQYYCRPKTVYSYIKRIILVHVITYSERAVFTPAYVYT